MISEERVHRLEDKIDKTSDVVIELKSEIIRMNDKFDETLDLVQEHITGDQKIIDQLEDLVPQLKEMTQDHLVRKAIREEKKQKREAVMQTVTDFSKVLGIVSVMAGTIFTIIKVLDFVGK